MLITRSDFSTFNRPISQSQYNTGKLEQHIQDAEFMDVKKLLGSDFYYDIQANPTKAEYKTLLDGGRYEFNGITYTNVGLKSVIVHYAYARYVLMGDQIDTPFGYVQKTNPDTSERVPYQMKKAQYEMNRQIAMSKWENVVNYIERNPSDYPLFDRLIRRNFKFSKISGKDI